MRDLNNVKIRNASERETLYVIPFVKDTFWNKDYKKVLALLEELEIPLKNIICIESEDTFVNESNFDKDLYKRLYELSEITFFKSNLVEGNDICIEGFNTLLYIINKRLLEKDYFVKIIMNPPYKGSLHLEIVDQMLKTFPEADIVNISPIGWLQDPLAEFKQSTDYKKYVHILKHLSNLDVIQSSDANKYFGINPRSDLGIYLFTKEGGFNVEGFRFDTPEKKLAYRLATEVFPNCERFNKDMNASKGVKFTFPATAGNTGKSDWGQLCSIDRKKAYDFKIPENPKNNYFSLSFTTELERDNFHSSLFTKFYQFYVASTRRTIKPEAIMPFIPHFFNVKWEGKTGTIDGYKNPITDEMLYEYFGLTDEEIKTVEDFYEELKSR